MSNRSRQRDQAVGNKLYSLFCAQLSNFENAPTLAGKVTGMCLSLEDSEVLQLLSSERELASTVTQALGMIPSLKDYATTFRARSEPHAAACVSHPSTVSFCSCSSFRGLLLIDDKELTQIEALLQHRQQANVLELIVVDRQLRQTHGVYAFRGVWHIDEPSRRACACVVEGVFPAQKAPEALPPWLEQPVRKGITEDHLANERSALADGLDSEPKASTFLLGWRPKWVEQGGRDLDDGACLVFASELSVAGCEALKTLYLGDNQIGDRGAVGLCSTLATASRLCELILACNRITDMAPLATMVHNLPELHTLNLHSNQLSCGFAEFGCALAVGAAPKLQHLDLDFNLIDDRGLDGLVPGLRHAQSLQTLQLGFNSFGSRGLGAICDILLDKCTLAKLRVHEHDLDVKIIIGSHARQQNKHTQKTLNELRAHYNGNDFWLVLLLICRSWRLRNINFAGWEVSDLGLVALGDALWLSGAMPQLVSIDLQQNCLTDGSVVALLRSWTLHGLPLAITKLNLERNELGTPTALAFADAIASGVLMSELEVMAWNDLDSMNVEDEGILALVTCCVLPKGAEKAPVPMLCCWARRELHRRAAAAVIHRWSRRRRLGCLSWTAPSEMVETTARVPPLSPPTRERSLACHLHEVTGCSKRDCIRVVLELDLPVFGFERAHVEQARVNLLHQGADTINELQLEPVAALDSTSVELEAAEVAKVSVICQVQVGIRDVRAASGASDLASSGSGCSADIEVARGRMARVHLDGGRARANLQAKRATPQLSHGKWKAVAMQHARSQAHRADVKERVWIADRSGVRSLHRTVSSLYEG